MKISRWKPSKRVSPPSSNTINLPSPLLTPLHWTVIEAISNSLILQADEWNRLPQMEQRDAVSSLWILGISTEFKGRLGVTMGRPC